LGWIIVEAHWVTINDARIGTLETESVLSPGAADTVRLPHSGIRAYLLTLWGTGYGGDEWKSVKAGSTTLGVPVRTKNLEMQDKTRRTP
jgi:hypothetical protein